jgi:hypothetical protein
LAELLFGGDYDRRNTPNPATEVASVNQATWYLSFR